ncbi:MAG: arginase family protein [Chitinophagaceae bacterium]|nr:arginase family protein [Chitinophagaceae bacterium]
MKYIPIGGKELNLGVENGPDEVLTQAFTKELGGSHIIEYNFSLPEEIPDDKYYLSMANEINELSQRIQKEFNNKGSNFIINIGGDHSIASSSLLSVLQMKNGENIGVIMFDSHGDLHLKRTSPTGNYHGMWLRPFWDVYDDTEIQNTINLSLKRDQLLFVGNLLLEEEEENFLSKNEIPIFSSGKFNNDIKNDSYSKLLDFCQKHDYIHVSFDIDVFKTDLVSATGTPNPDGFDRKMIFDIIDVLNKSGKIISLDLVEVNPKKCGAKETITLAQEVLKAFLV